MLFEITLSASNKLDVPSVNLFIFFSFPLLQDLRMAGYGGLIWNSGRNQIHNYSGPPVNVTSKEAEVMDLIPSCRILKEPGAVGKLE